MCTFYVQIKYYLFCNLLQGQRMRDKQTGSYDVAKDWDFVFFLYFSFYVRFSKMLKWVISKEQQTASKSHSKLIYKAIFPYRKLTDSQHPHSILPDYFCPPIPSFPPDLIPLPPGLGRALAQFCPVTVLHCSLHHHTSVVLSRIK